MLRAPARRTLRAACRQSVSRLPPPLGSPVSSRPLALEACGRLLPTHRLVSLVKAVDAPLLRLDVVTPVSSLPGFVSAENRRSPKFTGFPFHAPLPWPWTPVGRSATWPSFYLRRLPLGPRWVNGEDSSHWNFRGSFPRLWCSRSTLRASLTTDDA